MHAAHSHSFNIQPWRGRRSPTSPTSPRSTSTSRTRRTISTRTRARIRTGMASGRGTTRIGTRGTQGPVGGCRRATANAPAQRLLHPPLPEVLTSRLRDVSYVRSIVPDWGCHDISSGPGGVKADDSSAFRRGGCQCVVEEASLQRLLLCGRGVSVFLGGPLHPALTALWLVVHVMLGGGPGLWRTASASQRKTTSRRVRSSGRG